MRCDNCGATENVHSSLMFDLCPKCEDGLRREHQTYAEAQARRMSRDAGCPVPEAL